MLDGFVVPDTRLVDPWGVVAKDDVWYLIAGTERAQRTFRVDRIVSAEPSGSPAAEAPAGFSLAGAWAEIVGQMEELRSSTSATGRHLQVAGRSAGGDGPE